MIPVHFPQHDFKVKHHDGRELVFDTFRKLWVVLTPEEWVRQNFLQWLVQICNYPASLISVEKEIMLGDVRKRFDIVIYNRSGKPWLLVECKAMDIALDEAVLHQVLRYNQALEVSYLVITNGSFTKGFQLLPEFTEVAVMPDYL